MTRWKITLTVVTLLLTGCAAGDSSPGSSPEADFLAEHDLTGLEVTEIVDHLDRLGGPDRPAELMASVRVDELMLADDAQQVTLELPADRFYLSIAPYVHETHECFHHSLTTCQGELVEEDLLVRIVDDATGEVLVDDELTTFENGFLGLWLPRDVEGTIEITADGQTGTVPFSTGEEDATCLTTLQLT